jgi:GT2 family glycosyltransferase
VSERDLPFCSIIIPTFNRRRQLRACLQALAVQDYPRDRFEVVVVDDGSVPSSQRVIDAHRDLIDLTFLTQAHAGPAAARNMGAARARGEFLAFTDDDCTADPRWLRSLADALSQRPDCMVGGRTVNALVDNPYATASQLLVSYLYDYYNRVPRGAQLFTANNLAVAAEHYRTIGGFDATYPRAGAEDRDFCDRWRDHGYKMIYVPEAVVHHGHRLTLKSYCRMHARYGCGAYLYKVTRARRGRGAIQVEPLSFYVNLVRYPYKHYQGGQALRLAGLLLLSQAANVGGYLLQRLRGVPTELA